jgi:hypothetical protein
MVWCGIPQQHGIKSANQKEDKANPVKVADSLQRSIINPTSLLIYKIGEAVWGLSNMREKMRAMSFYFLLF